MHSRHNVRLFTAGQVVSGVGSIMDTTAVTWLLLHVPGGNASWLALAFGLQYFPLLVLHRPVGRLVDRMPRHRLLLAVQSLEGLLALSMGTVLLQVTPSVALFLAYVALLGLMQAVEVPARQVFFVDLLGVEGYRRGAGTYTTIYGVGRVTAPGLAGLLLAAVGAPIVFLLNAASFAAVILSVLRVDKTRLHSKTEPPTGDGSEEVGQDKRSQQKIVLTLVLIVGALAYQFQVTSALIVSGYFHSNARQYGLLGTCLSFGGIVGAYVSSRQGKASLVEVQLACLALGVFELLAGVAPEFGLYATLLVFCGVAFSFFTTTSLSLLQRVAAPGQRGKLMAQYNALFIGFVPVGVLVLEAVASVIGVRWTLILPGAIAAVVAVVQLGSARRLRREGLATECAVEVRSGARESTRAGRE